MCSDCEAYGLKTYGLTRADLYISLARPAIGLPDYIYISI